jgi:hypothetical protein
MRVGVIGSVVRPVVTRLRSLLAAFFNLRLLAVTNAGVLDDDAFRQDIPVLISSDFCFLNVGQKASQPGKTISPNSFTNIQS